MFTFRPVKSLAGEIKLNIFNLRWTFIDFLQLTNNHFLKKTYTAWKNIITWLRENRENNNEITGRNNQFTTFLLKFFDELFIKFHTLQSKMIIITSTHILISGSLKIHVLT